MGEGCQPHHQPHVLAHQTQEGLTLNCVCGPLCVCVRVHNVRVMHVRELSVGCHCVLMMKDSGGRAEPEVIVYGEKLIYLNGSAAVPLLPPLSLSPSLPKQL